jgi:hypothetical protein
MEYGGCLTYYGLKCHTLGTQNHRKIDVCKHHLISLQIRYVGAYEYPRDYTHAIALLGSPKVFPGRNYYKVCLCLKASGAGDFGTLDGPL